MGRLTGGIDTESAWQVHIVIYVTTKTSTFVTSNQFLCPLTGLLHDRVFPTIRAIGIKLIWKGV